MRKGVTPVAIILIVVLVVVGVMIFANKLNNNGTSISEIVGGSRIPKCTDTDGGLSIYTKGVCISAKGSYTDYCRSSYNLIEYQCYDNNCIALNVSCPSGYACSNGACI
jgi:hypothetical protein